ncbi:CARDB domain-containing protein [Archangium lipolyticum]|uniref:CARDB domain-containing protein n=1 Tax=Archangium lipolyticum TaxID=2970465 RepID=UPI002149A720|nr:CARDB domain-containing protein [Archangium lipolyticum]
MGKLRSALSGGTPDLRVSEVRGPSSAAPGRPFSVTVTVCNGGTETADINTDVFLSEDALIQTSDVQLASRTVNLKPDQCSTLDMNVDMGVSQAGSYHLGAIIDPFGYVPESDETNNTLLGNTLAIDAKPDLVLTAVTGPSRRSPYTPDSPVFFTVCNQGQPSPSTNVDLFLSTDTTISRDDDLFFANVWLDALAAGECRTQSVPTHTPPEGIFYLGGIVDPFDSVQEILENNNVLAGHRMAIGYGPDLVITSVQAPASARPGEPLGFSATICNQGFQPSFFSELAVRLSDDATVTPDDLLLGSVPVGDLDSGMCATVSVTGPATPPSGTWYVGAFADASQFVLELDEANNTSAPRAITFGSDADLTVSLKAPALARPGDFFRYTATVCNQGTSLGEPTTLDILLSSDATFSDEDLILGNAPVPQLAAGECTEISQETPSYAPPSSYFLGARVDGSHDVPELREDNNTSSPSPFVIGQGIDLTITSVRAPASALPGSHFDATVTVCNQGSDFSPGAMLALRLAPLDVATPVELPAGTAFVNGLAPGACENVTASVFPEMPMPLSGAWKLLALADSEHLVPELIESNNSASSNRIGLGYSADFVITSVSGPTRLSPYSNPETFAFVTVCNQGASSEGTHAELYLSQDPSITRDDMMAGNEPVGYLDPGQCRTTSVRIHSPSEGTFFLGARVVPSPQELFTDDNVATGNLVAIGNKADLVVTSVQAPTSMRPGEQVSTTATVCNLGFAPSYFSQAAVYLSQDTTVDPMQDFLIGLAPVGDLDMGQCASATVTGSAYVPAGTYFLIAAADDSNQVPELYEDNNRSAPRALSIGSGSDLTVSLQAPAVARPGEPLTLTATVCNQGNEPSTHAPLDFLFSQDATLSIQDPHLTGAPVEPLAPGACSTHSQQVHVPPENGFLGAIIDGPGYVNELREDNNTSAASALVTGFGPDLTITSVQAPHSALPGSHFDATITVCNQGSDFSPGAMLALRLAPLDVATPVELPAGTAFVNSLAPGACENVTASVFPEMPMPLSGAWKLLALVDSEHLVPELIESNNSASSNRIGLGYSADFVITSVSGPTRLSPYSSPDTVAFVTVCNQGASSAGADAELFFSQDASITHDDMPAGNEPVGYLDPGQCRTTSVRIHAPSEGTFFLGAHVRPAPQEIFVDDNSVIGHRVTIGSRADLVVTSVQAPASIQPNAPLDASATVCNQGTTPSYGSDLHVLLSQDANVSQHEDFRAGVVHVGMLEASQCTTVSLTDSVPIPSGTWYLAALADASGYEPELDEDNNLSASRILVVGLGADLTVSVSTPTSARPGMGFDVLATVCNQGTAPSQHSHVDVLLSSDDALTHSDFFLGGAPVEPLAPGACTSLSVTASASQPEGTWFLGAIVDGPGTQPELREDNNASTTSVLGLGQGPDLVVTSVQAPTASHPDTTFPATLEVCNKGTEPSPTTQVELKLAAQGLGSPVELPAGIAPVGPLAPGACESVATNVSSAVPVGTWKLLARVDAQHFVPELVESNNSASSQRIGIGYAPDFVITSIDAPALMSPSEGATVHVTVCNQGSDFGAGAPDVGVMLSQDASISRNDMHLMSVPVNDLAPGECRTVDAAISSMPEGTFHVGAILTVWMPELFRDNNTAVGPRVAIGDRAELAVTSVQAPTSVQEGGAFTSAVNVCNQGFDISNPTNVEVRLAGQGPESLLVGNAMVPELEPGHCQTVSVESYANVPLGAYTLEAVVDPHNQVWELLEDNNRKTGHTITVTN